MARRSLKPQLNQIRTWVRQGRTDAWIAHQLDVSASELSEFRRRHDLSPDAEDSGEVDLRDEIEAEIEAAAEAEAEEDEDTTDEGEDTTDEGEEERPRREEGGDATSEEDADAPPRRRRRRRGGRGKRAGAGLQATFDHGESDGYGLWLDPAVADDPVYGEHWAGHRPVEVTIEPDRIVIRRS